MSYSNTTNEPLTKSAAQKRIYYNNKYISIKEYCNIKGLTYNTIKSAAQRKKKEMIDLLIEKNYIIRKDYKYIDREE